MGSDEIRLSNSQTLRILRTADDALEVEATWEPGGSPPPTHWHPHQHEHFEVLEGELTVRQSGIQSVVAAGETLDVPPRTAHSMWNAGPAPCHASWRVTPPQRTEEMLRTAGSVKWLGRVRMLWTYRNEYRLGSPRGG